MNTNFIIGICGNARSGKDTFCEYAKKYYLQGADEVLYIDIVSSLYRRDIIFNEIAKTLFE